MVDGVGDVFGHRQAASEHFVDVEFAGDAVDLSAQNVERRREGDHREEKHHQEAVDDVLDDDALEHHREDVDVFRNAAEEHEGGDPAEEEDDRSHSTVVDVVRLRVATRLGEPNEQCQRETASRQPVHGRQKKSRQNSGFPRRRKIGTSECGQAEG